MKLIKVLTAITIVLVANLSCQKDFLISGLEQPPVIETPATISTTISGRILDEAGKPLQGAQVKTEFSLTSTDINGEFKIQNALVGNKVATVEVVRAGYFTGSRSFVATTNQSHFVEIQLLKRTINGTISSATGGTVTLTNGTGVTLPSAPVIVKSTGTAYTGNVNISAAWIDPTSPDLYKQMPGDLRGLDNNNTEVGLESFGMIAVELTGDGGEVLQIAPNKKASLKFPLPTSIITAAPATIPLWSYNEKKGLWIQEGTATKSGNFYIADVTHFSFWNCDAPFPVVDFSATVKDQNGQPMKNVEVRLRRVKSNTYTNGRTDGGGIVKGKIPSNETVTLEVINSCGTVAHTQTVGPFTGNATVSITVASSGTQTATISGSAVNCTNAAVAKGSAELLIGQKVYRAPISNGVFNFSVELCNANQAATITVTDSATNQQGSSAITLNPGANTMGTSSACGTAITQFVNVTINGTAYSFSPPSDSISAFIRQQPVSTLINAYKTTSNIVQKVSIDFSGASVGTFLINSFTVTVPGIINGQLPQATNVSTTEFGTVGGYIAGSFSGSVIDSSGTKPLQCSFRVKRTQ